MRRFKLTVVGGVVFALAVPAAFGQAVPNGNCSLIVPANPLTAKGLATPYQLVAADPAQGECHETAFDGQTFVQAAFVQAAILDPFSGQVSIYNPLVVDKGTVPAVAPVVPKLPPLAVVALWFGFNGDNLTLVGARLNTLSVSQCHQGMGQFAYCNAAAFFQAANAEVRAGKLRVPPLGISPMDFQPCPTTRSFAVVDQDQSDNLPLSYLVATDGRVAQNTAANRALLPGATLLKNPSDNGLTDNILGKALGCSPLVAPDLADPGASVPALPLNELTAAAWQMPPVALVPLGDPFVKNDLALVNLYRAGVNQRPAATPRNADTAKYCTNLVRVGTEKLILDRAIFTGQPSPFPMQADSLFTWMAMRLKNSFDNLGCGDLLNRQNPVTLFPDTGTVTDAVIR